MTSSTTNKIVPVNGAFVSMHDDRDTVVVIFVGGWSPGPLSHLQRFARNQQHIAIVELKNLPMPPLPGSWCYDPYVLAMIALLLICCWVVSHINFQELWAILILYIILFGNFIVWLRYFASVVVRSAVRKGVEICWHELRRHQGKVVMVGFSWGGAVRIQ